MSWSSWTKDWFSGCLEGWNKYFRINKKNKAKNLKTNDKIPSFADLFCHCHLPIISPTGQGWITNRAKCPTPVLRVTIMPSSHSNWPGVHRIWISFKFSHKISSVTSAQTPQIPSRTDCELCAPRCVLFNINKMQWKQQRHNDVQGVCLDCLRKLLLHWRDKNSRCSQNLH